ncbi:50S ribosomal protein L10 [Desulfococcaceae bacterium HSG8]|nr:50S ribosomal protein L10 [Desulfococcaceae bacterium HSG8]
MKLDKKKEIVKDLHEKFSKSEIVIVTDYKGLDVMAMNDLRRKLREAEAEYQVAKNTLIIRASEDTDAAKLRDKFKGPSAIALTCKDPVALAKALTEFSKENNKLEIRGAVMSGKELDLSDIKSLSSLPSREVLLAQVLSTMNGVPTAFVRVLSGVPRNFLNVLNALKEQKEAA